MSTSPPPHSQQHSDATTPFEAATTAFDLHQQHEYEQQLQQQQHVDPSALQHFQYAQHQQQFDLDAAEMISIQPHPQQHHLHPSLLYPFGPASSSSGSSSAFASTSAPSQPQLALLSDSPPPQVGGAAGVTGAKRYRSAPAKTFQCAGYGECRMVFSRSEHLARHIRKHTGERPFACHCTKQFSRLDNLRQHAQTVHSAPEDKPLNERMMRALAGVNASMMAGVRGRRRYESAANAYPSGSASPVPSPGSTPPYSTTPPYAAYSGTDYAGPLPSPPYSVPSSASSSTSGGGSPSFAPCSFSSSTGAGSPPFASPQLSEYSATSAGYEAAGGSPLPSPSFGAFPPSAYAREQDYLSRGGVRVKQEENDLEGFYAALEGRHPHHYASSSSLSSTASSRSAHSPTHSYSSSEDDERPDTATPAHHGRPAFLRGLSSSSSASSVSAHSSPAGSPCVPSFWPQGSQQQQQRRGGEQLPSPPQSPYYPASYPHHHPSAPPQSSHQQGSQQLYAWLEDGSVSSLPMASPPAEMSNAQYYASLQSPHHQGQGQQEYFSYAPPHGRSGTVYA